MKPEPPNTVTTRAAIPHLFASRPAAAYHRVPSFRGGAHIAGQRRAQQAKPVDFGLYPSTIAPSVAQVAELADAQVSGTCGRKVVEVRVFSWAPRPLTRPMHQQISP